jgi:hypothetical protein
VRKKRPSEEVKKRLYPTQKMLVTIGYPLCPSSYKKEGGTTRGSLVRGKETREVNSESSTSMWWVVSTARR